MGENVATGVESRRIDALRTQLEAAENAGDADTIEQVMAEDAVVMVPNAPVQTGRAQCAAFIRGILAEQRAWFDRHITYWSDEITVFGEVAIDRGRFSFTTVARHDGSTHTAAGKYLWLYGRTEADWRLRRAIMSLDEEPEGGECEETEEVELRS